jgi:hypothetical protein
MRRVATCIVPRVPDCVKIDLGCRSVFTYRHPLLEAQKPEWVASCFLVDFLYIGQEEMFRIERLLELRVGKG